MEKTFKRLLSFAVALFMVIGMIPGNVFQAFAAEEESTETGTQDTLAAEIAAASKANLPDGVQKIIEDAAKIPSSDAEIQKHIDAGTCPMCGAENITWVRKTGQVKPGAGEAIHCYMDSEFALGTNILWPQNANSSICCALLSTAVLKSRTYRTFWASGANSKINVMGTGKVAYHMTGSNPASMLDVSGAGAQVNLYGGTYIFSGEVDGFEKQSAINVNSTGGSFNIFNNVVIGPETAPTSYVLYNAVVQRGTLNMYGGTIRNGVTNNANRSGNVTVANKDNIAVAFNMYGGTISGGTYNPDKVSGTRGGNVLVGGVYDITSTTVRSGEFNMYGGTITGGNATTGGNIRMQHADSVANIYGGKIEKGTAENGGNVAGYQGELLINDGAIVDGSATGKGGNIYYYADSNNKGKSLYINSGLISGGTAKSGGNIYMSASKAASTRLYLGTDSGEALKIANGSTSEANNAAGGNVYGYYASVTVGSTCTIDGGISRSTKSQGGGNICVEGGSRTLTTSGTIINGKTTKAGYGGNIHIYDGAALEIKGGVIANGSNEDSGWGGNIYALNENVTIKGGLIYGGNCKVSPNSDNIAVLTDNSTTGSTLTITGGVIVGGVNTSKASGTTPATKIVLSGAPKIVKQWTVDGKVISAEEGGILVYDGNTMDISGVTEGAQICINGLSADQVLSAVYEGTEAIANCFFANDKGYCVVAQDNQLVYVQHEQTEIAKTAATCEAIGYSADGFYCATCDEYYNADYTAPIAKADMEQAALGHDYKSVVTAPTCTAEGYTTYTCANDANHTYVAETVEANGHDFENGTVVATDAGSCNTKSSTTTKCANCDETQVTYGELNLEKHVNTKVLEAVEGDCSNAGLSEGLYCNDCKTTLVKQEETQLGDHKIVLLTEEVAASGCVTFGKEAVYTCTVCGAFFADAEGEEEKDSNTPGMIFPEGHKLTYVEGYAATCSANGVVAHYACSVCGNAYAENNEYAIVTMDTVIPMFGHTEEAVAGKAPSCTETGLTDGVKCAVCGETITAQEEIPVIGHNYESVTTPADCENDGKIVYTCSRCGDSYEEIIPASHTYTNNCDMDCNVCGEYRDAPHTLTTYVEAVVPANCQETGHEEYWICADCGGYFMSNGMGGYYEINPAWMSYTGEHVRPEGSIVCAIVACAICGEDTYGEACDRGEAPVCQNAPCVNCGEIVWGEGCTYGYDEDWNPLSPFCQPGDCIYCGTHYEKLYDCENGSWASCSVDGECVYGCGKQYPATGEHMLDDPCAGGLCWLCWETIEGKHTEETVTGKAPSCTETGLTDGVKCSVCGETITAQEEIPALGHTEETVTGKAPSCTETGLTDGVKCSVCGETITAQEEIPAQGHSTVLVTEGTPATCLKPGTTAVYTCNTCGAYFEDAEGKVELDSSTPGMTFPNGHELTFVAGSAATCTEAGVEAHYLCSVCGNAYAEEDEYASEAIETVIPVSGHTAGEPTIENKVEATLNAPGSYDEVVYCSVCTTELSRENKTIEQLTGAVAAINGYNYATLEEAAAAAKANETIVVLENVTVTFVQLPADVTLDLNGKTVSGTVLGKLVMNGGDLITAEGYKMIGANADYYKTSQATVNMTATEITIESGDVTLAQSWWTLPGQTLTIGKDATFTIPAGIQMNVNGSTVIVEGAVVNNGAIRLMNGAVAKGTVLGKLILENGDLITAEGYKMIGANADYYKTSQATVNMTATEIEIVSGTVTLAQSWWTLPGQTLTIGKDATFTIPEGMTMNVNGAAVVVEGTAVVNGSVTLYSKDATVKAIAGLNVVTAAGDCVWYNEGTYVVHDHSAADAVIENEVPATLNAPGSYDEVVYCAVCTTELSRESKTIEQLTGAVAAINGYNYATLAEALAAVEEGQTITLLKPIVVAKGETLELNLNGFDIAYTSDVMGEAMFTNNGTLILTGNGKISYTYTGAADSNFGKGNYTIANNGTLTVAGATIENATAKMRHASYAITNGNGGAITLNSGLIVNETNYAVRMFGNGSLTVNGGEIRGTRAVWMQAPGSDTSAAPTVALTVNGGKLNGTGESAEYKLAVYSYSYGNSLENVSITVNGGEIEGDIALTGGQNKTAAETVTVTGGKLTDLYSYAADEVAAETINISGGTFAVEVYEAYCAEGYMPAANEDGTYGVTEDPNTAKIGDEKYLTVEAALAAAKPGETIVMTADSDESGSILVLFNGVTLDLNGKTLKANYLITTNGGANVIDSSDGEGLLVIAKNNLTVVNQSCLPIWIEAEGGYRFVQVTLKMQGTAKADGSFLMQYYFTGALDGALKTQFQNVAQNDMKLVLRVTYKSMDGSNAILNLVIPAEKVVEYGGKAEGKGLFETTVFGLEKLGTATLTPYLIVGNTELCDGSVTYTAPTN